MEKQRVRGRERKRPPGSKASSPEWRRAYRFAKYGLTEDQFYGRLARQGSACAMCREPFKGDQAIYVDHDHACCPEDGKSCGKCVRGLLCLRCNAALGHIERMWELAEAYLCDPPGKRAGWRDAAVLA